MTPVLTGVGLDAGTPHAQPERTSELLASADVVFVPAGDAERAALFYAEAWRVETLGADAAVQIALALAARPGSIAVVAGHDGFERLADEVAGLLGDVRVLVAPGSLR